MSYVAEHGSSKLRILQRQGLNPLNHDQVWRRILTSLKAFDLVLLVDHLVLILELHEVSQPRLIVFGSSVRVHSNARNSAHTRHRHVSNAWNSKHVIRLVARKSKHVIRLATRNSMHAIRLIV